MNWKQNMKLQKMSHFKSKWEKIYQVCQFPLGKQKDDSILFQYPPVPFVGDSIYLFSFSMISKWKVYPQTVCTHTDIQHLLYPMNGATVTVQLWVIHLLTIIDYLKHEIWCDNHHRIPSAVGEKVMFFGRYQYYKILMFHFWWKKCEQVLLEH